jgi:hypothetical protein
LKRGLVFNVKVDAGLAGVPVTSALILAVHFTRQEALEKLGSSDSDLSEN